MYFWLAVTLDYVSSQIVPKSEGIFIKGNRKIVKKSGLSIFIHDDILIKKSTRFAIPD